MRRRHLRSQKRQLCAVERCPGHGPEVDREISRCDGRDKGGDVREGAVEGGDGAVVEKVAGCDGLDLVQGSVACADDGDGAGSELVGRVDGGEPAAGFSKASISKESLSWIDKGERKCHTVARGP